MTQRAKSGAVAKPATIPLWVLTREVNAYYQYGAYFVDVFGSKPTAEMLNASLAGDGQIRSFDAVVTGLLESGGGRLGVEDVWYNLDEYPTTIDSLATQLEQATRDLADLRARGVVPDADCTCGSGGHPRPCAKHPHRMEMHAREIDTENALEQMRRERDEARADVGHARAQLIQRGLEVDALVSEKRDATEAFHEATRLRGLCQEACVRAEQERDEALAELRTTARELGEARADLAEARATNARLHRRAQGVDARKPEDADLIRRLRADVRGQAKHAGHVIGYVFRLRCALSDSQHATSMAVRERDEARAHAEERTAKVRDLARCAAASEARARAYAAKLARIREVAECDYHDTPRIVLRIIDEKEGGQ